MAGLTHKQELFATLIVQGRLSASDAYRAAYNATKMKPATVHRTAHEVLHTPNVAARIAELQREAAEAAKVTLTGHLEDLLKLRNDAAAAGEFAPAVRAEIARANAAGLLEEKHQHTIVGLDWKALLAGAPADEDPDA